jgi:hypothetical protein
MKHDPNGFLAKTVDDRKIYRTLSLSEQAVWNGHTTLKEEPVVVSEGTNDDP